MAVTRHVARCARIDEFDFDKGVSRFGERCRVEGGSVGRFASIPDQVPASSSSSSCRKSLRFTSELEMEVRGSSESSSESERHRAIQAASSSALAAVSFGFGFSFSLLLPSCLSSFPFPFRFGFWPSFPPPSSQQSLAQCPGLPQLLHLPFFLPFPFFPPPSAAEKAAFSSFLDVFPRLRRSYSSAKACINSSGDRTVPKTLEVAFRAEMNGSKEEGSDPRMIA